MIFETNSFLSDLPAGVSETLITPLWQQMGFADKGEWKRAGRPGLPPDSTVSVGAGSSGDPGTPVDGVMPGAVTGTAGAGSGGGFSLSGIPSSYLMIGGAIILLMVLKR